MTSPDCFQLLSLFRRVVPASFFRELARKHGYRFRDGIYHPSVVVWLMIWQKLQGNRSTAAAVQHLLQGGAQERMNGCQRWRRDQVSAATGGYCQARQKLPKLIACEVMERMVEQLRAEMQEGWEGLHRPVFLIDGSTLQLRHEEELVREFSPGRNQHGENHWPVLQIVVFHDVFSGLALRPSWGPMYGDKPTSEQGLAREALERLPADAVVLADSNFGIFAFAYAVEQSQRAMVLRLTKQRAKKILGIEPAAGMDRKVTWSASSWEAQTYPELPAGAAVDGRVVVCADPSRSDELLCLFTTLDLEPEQILGMYRLRWNVETDLRSIKRTVELHKLTSKNKDMVEKELLLAMAAYNMVRAVMCLAARKAQITPRQLSFSFVQTVVEAALPGLDRAASEEEYQQRLERMLRYAAQGKLPNRSRRRTYPRKVWGQGSRFPKHRRPAAKGGAGK